VLVDAFIVRMLLIPAVMRLLGDAAWWFPQWLDRLLPDVDVEGAKLERAHPSRGHDGAAAHAAAGAVDAPSDDPHRDRAAHRA
jgi:RND superfamily putative drug exporter